MEGIQSSLVMVVQQVVLGLRHKRLPTLSPSELIGVELPTDACMIYCPWRSSICRLKAFRHGKAHLFIPHFVHHFSTLRNRPSPCPCGSAVSNHAKHHQCEALGTVHCAIAIFVTSTSDQQSINVQLLKQVDLGPVGYIVY